MTDKAMHWPVEAITPGEALWILNNIPQTPPRGAMPTAWLNHRKRIIAKLQRIVNAAALEADYYRLLNY